MRYSTKSNVPPYVAKLESGVPVHEQIMRITDLTARAAFIHFNAIYGTTPELQQAIKSVGDAGIPGFVAQDSLHEPPARPAKPKRQRHPKPKPDPDLIAALRSNLFGSPDDKPVRYPDAFEVLEKEGK